MWQGREDRQETPALPALRGQWAVQVTEGTVDLPGQWVHLDRLDLQVTLLRGQADIQGHRDRPDCGGLSVYTGSRVYQVISSTIYLCIINHDSWLTNQLLAVPFWQSIKRGVPVWGL